MSPDLQHALVYLVGALMLATPAALRTLPRVFQSFESAISRWAKARADVAAAQLVTAQSARDEMAAVRKELDELRAEHAECLARVTALRAEMQEWMRAAASGGRYPR